MWFHRFILLWIHIMQTNRQQLPVAWMLKALTCGRTIHSAVAIITEQTTAEISCFRFIG